MAVQLTLGVALRDEATFENFYVSENQQVVRCLNELVTAKGESIIYLWSSQRDVGITHLLQACCHLTSEKGNNAIFLPLSKSGLTPEILQDLELVDTVCVDDVDEVLGKPEWEEALLHLYNRVRDGGSRLVIGAKKMPYLAHCNLPDLKSRLSWGLALRVDALTDQEKLCALQMRMKRRGLIVSSQVAQFLLRHYGSEMKGLFEVVEKLDRASLREKRKLTIPFIKQAVPPVRE